MNKSPIRILIADDDDGDRRQLRRLVRTFDTTCEIEEALDLREAEEACAASSFDCAIIDYRMPGGDGLKGIVALRERHPHLPIIMVTGQGDELIASEAIKLGAADYVPKAQLAPGYLAHVLKNAMRKAELERIVADQRDELERFAYVLAHDLKTPIHQIQYLVQFILRDFQEGDAEKLQQNGDRLLATARRMEDLINALQRYTTSSKPAEFDRVDLDAALDGCLANLAAEIAARNVGIKRVDLPVVIGSLPLLTQLFQNLVGNAIKYCSAEAPLVSVGCQKEDHHWTVSVADNGAGIEEADRETVFQPFKRLSAGGQTDGTGLGLAICRKIVERHGGQIWCEAAPQGGSLFCFTLPYESPRPLFHQV